MKKYKLILLGYMWGREKDSEKYTPITNLRQIRLCFQMILYGLYLSFKKLKHVDVIRLDDRPFEGGDPVTYDFSKMPKADFVVSINYGSYFKQEVYDKIKKRCKKYVSFVETGQELCDFSFTMREYCKFYKIPEENTLIIPAPFTPEFYKNVKKEPKTILLDHSKLVFWKEAKKNKWDWNREIWDWLEELKDEYKIYTLIKPRVTKHGDWEKEHLKVCPSYVKCMASGTKQHQSFPFPDYLKMTDRIETYIVTHAGSYNFTVTDMLVRGIKVLTPPGFIPSYNIERFKIPTFTNKKELINEIKKPIAKKFWNNQIKLCTPMDKAAKIMDKKFQEWL